ncbi:MAG: hypothetical protein VX430_07710 [Pseudomonadota bacterium]|nr:hypothetical protein [Pseudomonadota bacterium]
MKRLDRAIKSTAIFIILALLASACAKNSKLFGGGELSGLACPQVAVLEGPGELTRFVDGKTGKIADVLFQARVEIIGSTCTYEGNSVVVTADTKLRVIRGPAETKREVKLTIFVSVIDEKRTVILWEAMPIVVKFQGPNRNFEFENPVSVQIDLKKGVDLASYSIYGGFEMTSQELEFNRRRQR